MSWSDVAALEQFNKLKELYDIDLFIETGTYKGINAAVHANNFKTIITIEKNVEYYNIAIDKLKTYNNIKIILGDSADCLSSLRVQIQSAKYVFIYLDAHFYDSSLPIEDRWVILRELESLKRCNNCIIAIHDFDNGELGHLTYDEQSLNFQLLERKLYNVNPNFKYYTNTKDTCDIITVDRVQNGEIPNLIADESTVDNLNYAWSSESKTKRGILYCTPTGIDLSQFEVIPFIMK